MSVQSFDSNQNASSIVVLFLHFIMLSVLNLNRGPCSNKAIKPNELNMAVSLYLIYFRKCFVFLFVRAYSNRWLLVGLLASLGALGTTKSHDCRNNHD